ncbi:MAG: MMPL family transporter [Acidobacteria bacterium]|nr:MMPL family transporter [Acidobacteriota bacterium]
MSSFFERLTAFILRRPRTILLAAALIVLAAAGAASRLRLDPDILKLIPQENREINEFRNLLQQTGTIDFHVVVLQLRPGADPAAYASLIDDLGERMQRSPRIEQATWKLPDPFALIDKVLPYAMLILTPEQLEQVRAKLSDEAIRESVTRNHALLQTPQSTIAKQLVRVDPFNLLPIYLEKLQRAGGGFELDLSTGYYVSADHSTIVLIGKPRRPAQDLPFSRELLHESRAQAEAALAEFRKANPQVAAPQIGFTGGYAIAAGDEAIIRQDIILNVITSVGGVLALFLYAFRRPAALAYSGLPMMGAIVVTFGIASLRYGTLSASSTGFAALLAGLGVDFITVLYERYVDERNRGASLVDAIYTCMRHSLPGVAVAACTTAATFYGFLATDFRGMTELGFLTGSGILVFLLFVVLLFPALLYVVERRRKSAYFHVHEFGSTKLVRVSLAKPRLVIGVWIALIVLAGLAGTQVRFSDDIQNLRSKGNDGVRLQQVVTQKFGQSFDFMMYAVRGNTAAEAVAKSEAGLRELEQLADAGKLGSVQSIGAFLPTESQQRNVIERLRTFEPERVERTFRAALVANGFRPNAYDDVLPLFAKAMRAQEPVTVATLENVGLGESLQRFVKKTPDGFVAIAYLYPKGGPWPRSLPPELQAFRARHPEGVLTGVNLVAETLRGVIRADAVRASLVGFLVVFTLLVIGFRSLARAVLVFVPFLAGCACMLGLMAALGLEFNFMNIFIGLMLVGTATDYAVYMLQRYDESPDAFPALASETARAVTLAAVTSIVGFGSFAISHYPGLRSIGYAATFGVGMSCLASITLLPALLATGRFKRS